jgi:hypothetical protein
MLIKPFRGKVGITFQDIHDNGTPRYNVAMLRVFVETNKAADNVGTKTKSLVSEFFSNIAERYSYGMRAASVSERLFFLSSRSS